MRVDYPQTPADDNATGTPDNPTVVDVLANDDTVDPTTVKIVDPTTGNPVTALVVAGEGNWTVDPATGEITFTPEAGFTGDPTPITYTAEDTLGNPTAPATVNIDYLQVLTDDNVTGIPGESVTIDVLSNDDTVDPTSVNIIDPITGNPVTELVVSGEGTWTVDTETGEITFVPLIGFTDDPTPIDYTAKDTNGHAITVATVMIDYSRLLTISGSILSDGTGNNNVNGSPISMPDGTPLYVSLIDDNGRVVAVVPVSTDGTYILNETVLPNREYTIVVSSITGRIGRYSPPVILPSNWNYTGENINSQSAGNDGTVDGKITINVGTTDITEVDFGINKKPVAQNIDNTSMVNPGGNQQIQIPALIVSDNEDVKPHTITIETIPDNAVLYYYGVVVHAGQIIENFDSRKFTLNPKDGNQIVEFTYAAIDSDGVKSTPALVSLVFNATCPTCTPTPTPTPTPMATHAHASNISEHSAVLHWNDSYYEIYYVVYVNGIEVVTLDEDTTEFKLDNLASNTNYSCTIVAYDGYGGKTRQIIEFDTKEGLGWLPAIYNMLLQ